MYENIEKLDKYAFSLCENNEEKDVLKNTWGVSVVYEMIEKDRKNNYSFYHIFEPVYFKMLASYYSSALSNIFYERLYKKHENTKELMKNAPMSKEFERKYKEGFIKADKESKNMQAAFDKYVDTKINQ